MKKLIELMSSDGKKRFRGEIFVDVFVDSPEEATAAVAEIQKDIPNSYVGEVTRL
jgi:hypothetical protein